MAEYRETSRTKTNQCRLNISAETAKEGICPVRLLTLKGSLETLKPSQSSCCAICWSNANEPNKLTGVSVTECPRAAFMDGIGRLPLIKWSGYYQYLRLVAQG